MALAILIPITFIINSYFSLNPVFYLFIYSLLGIMILILSLRNKRIWVPILFTYNAVDYLLVIFGICLIVVNFADSSLLETQILRYCFSFVLLFFMPGWLIVRVLQITEKFHKIPILVISFSVSLGITSVIYTALLISNAEPSGLIIALVYGGMSLIPVLLRHVVSKGSDHRIFVKNRKKDYNLIEIITLVWITCFFVYSISYIYPEMVYVPGFDIVRHYAAISIVEDHSELFRSPYPWFHLSFGALNDVTDSEMWIIQTGNSLTSIILLLAFYSMAKAYLYKSNKYAHLLSTIIFSAFSGFGWIFYYQNMQPLMSFNDTFNLFSISYIATYFDIGVGQSQWLWLWFRPLTIDFILTLLLLFLMRMENLTRSKFLILSSILIVTLSLVHFPGLLLLVFIIFCLAIFVPKIRLRTRNMALSLIIALPISALISIFYMTIFGADSITFDTTYAIILEGVALISLILLIYSKRVKISIKLNHKRIISIVLLLYGILFVYWLTNIDSIKNDINEILSFPGGIYSVPISVLPHLLGFAGFLSIPILITILMKDRRNSLMIFPIIFVFVFVIGKIISYIISNFQLVDYWERRLVPYLWITASILAPIAVIKVLDYINGIKTAGTKLIIVKRLVGVFFIFALIIGSTMSTFLSLEYQAVRTLPDRISDTEAKLLDEVKNLDPHSTILSITPRSKGMAEYQSFNYNVGFYSEQIWPSTSPELPMNILNGLNTTALLYLNNQDLDKIIEYSYSNGFVASHILKNAPEIQNNSEYGKITHIPRQAPPTPSSDMVLILPNHVSKSQYYAYDILSLGQYNFTTALLSDIPTIKKAKILVAPTEELATAIIDSRNEMGLDFENLIIFNLDGYGQIGRIDGKFLDPRINHTDLIKYEYNNKENLQNNPVTYSRVYDKPLDISEYNYIKFDWIGQGRNQNNTIEFSSHSNNTIKFIFKDTWRGAKEMVFPMDLKANSESGIDEFYIQKDITNNTFWSDISKITIVTSEKNINSKTNIDFDDFLFIPGLKSDNIKLVTSNETLKFNPSSIIPATFPSSFEVHSTFDNINPFVLQNEFQDYNIHYVNIFPLLRSFHDNNISSQQMYSLYGDLLDGLGINLPQHKGEKKSPADFVKGGVAAFRNGTFSGDVEMQSTSTTIRTNTVDSTITIDGREYEVSKLSQILPYQLDHVRMKSNSSTIAGVYGFYTLSQSPHQTVVTFVGNPVVISLIYDNDENQLIYGNNITIKLDNAEILFRQPKVTVDGISNFNQFYSYGELNDRLRTLNSDIQNTGKSNFQVKYADKFIVAEKVNLSGKYETALTGYFMENGDVNLLKIENLLKLETLSIILGLILLWGIYNFYITRRKNEISN